MPRVRFQAMNAQWSCPQSVTQVPASTAPFPTPAMTNHSPSPDIFLPQPLWAVLLPHPCAPLCTRPQCVSPDPRLSLLQSILPAAFLEILPKAAIRCHFLEGHLLTVPVALLGKSMTLSDCSVPIISNLCQLISNLLLSIHIERPLSTEL